MIFKIYFLIIPLWVFITNRVLCVDMKRTDIKTVNDETRYLALNPNATFNAFNRVNHAKGNIIFTAGKRIDGDGLFVTFMDQIQFARLTDTEVSLWYPAEGHEGQIISCVEFVTDLSTSDAAAYFINGDGIGSTYAEMLVVANDTYNFGYQVYLYGY